MTKVRLSYDGWLTLPKAVRRKLGVGTGDQLDLELVQGAVILRPTTTRATAVAPHAAGPVAAMPTEIEAEPVAAIPQAVAEPVKRGPGRPRKITSATALPARLKSRGRRAAAPAAV